MKTNKLKNMMMDEKELDMVVGGSWSRAEIMSIIKGLVKNEDHTVIYDGVKMVLTMDTDDFVIGDFADSLYKNVKLAELNCKTVKQSAFLSGQEFEVSRKMLLKVDRA